MNHMHGFCFQILQDGTKIKKQIWVTVNRMCYMTSQIIWLPVDIKDYCIWKHLLTRCYCVISVRLSQKMEQHCMHARYVRPRIRRKNLSKAIFPGTQITVRSKITAFAIYAAYNLKPKVDCLNIYDRHTMTYCYRARCAARSITTSTWNYTWKRRTKHPHTFAPNVARHFVKILNSSVTSGFGMHTNCWSAKCVLSNLKISQHWIRTSARNIQKFCVPNVVRVSVGHKDLLHICVRCVRSYGHRVR